MPAASSALASGLVSAADQTGEAILALLRCFAQVVLVQKSTRFSVQTAKEIDVARVDAPSPADKF
jgi:hypothetical protein